MRDKVLRSASTLFRLKGETTLRAKNNLWGIFSLCISLVVINSMSGCESSVDEPSTDGTQIGGPTYDGSGFGVMPGEVKLPAAYSSTVQFEALNGREPYTWRVSRSDLGSISASGLYTSSARAGENTITVSDGSGRSVRAKVIQETPVSSVLNITPAVTTLDSGVINNVNFVGNGGVPPYSWSVTEARLGTVNTSGRYQNNLDENGSNYVVLRDSNGSTVTALVIQE